MAAGLLALIAGAGELPHQIAAEVSSRGEALVVLPLRGFAEGSFGPLATAPIDLVDPGGAVAALRQAGAARVVLAGTVHRPSLALITSGWQAMKRREEIRSLMRGGDDNLLRGVVGFLEANGFAVLGVGEVAPGLMAGELAFATRRPGGEERADASYGLAMLRALGPFDVGQAAVVLGRRVLAVEAAEGTDALLRRVAALRRGGPVGRLLRHGRPPLGERAGGVLVKASKPGQDERVDLPVIGPRTVRLAALAGLAGLAVEAGGVLLVDRPGIKAAADRLGLFVEGIAS